MSLQFQLEPEGQRCGNCWWWREFAGKSGHGMCSWTPPDAIVPTSFVDVCNDVMCENEGGGCVAWMELPEDEDEAE